MINKNHAENIRQCQRIKFDQALYILTMYEKKIRKSKKNSNGIIDAEVQMQDIINSWKNKWKMDLTKPILNCVTSVHPRILIDLSRQESQELANYYFLLNKFLTRFRTEHEDQTNFKLVMQVYDRQIQYMSADKYHVCSKATVKGFLLMAKNLANQQINKMLDSEQLAQNLGIQRQSLEWQVLGPLKYVKQISTKALYGQNGIQIENDKNIQAKCQKAENLVAFSTNIVKIIQKIKESQHGSTLITVQPKIDELTLLIHPLLIGISANFKKQNNEKTKDFDWSKIQVDSIPMMQNLKSSYNCSKIVFINLDGYESQYNLQFVRNFKKHLLYISFPKEQAKLDDLKQIYSRRFFKKMMFKHSQEIYESFNQSGLSDDYKNLNKLVRLTFNPEDYHCCAQKLYQYKNDKSNDDINQNMYIFPIRMSILNEKFPQNLQNRQDIQNHESYFIRFIIKDFLLNQIRQFNPTLIMISYSGRLNIEDNHFVQLMQQFTKISNYKLLFFPNFTSAFVDQNMAQTEEQCQYDNYIKDPRICNYFSNDKMSQGNEESDSWVQLFNKIARFLKVSSGTYNLTRTFQEEPLVSKYKNQFILTYIDQLMAVLGKQYQNIDRIRFRNKDLSILPKLFEQNIKNIKKTFQQTVPKLYYQIYEIIEYMLFDLSHKNIKQKKLKSEYAMQYDGYVQLLTRLYDEILNKSHYEYSAINIEKMQQQIQKQKIKKMKETFYNLRESHFFQISSEKFQQKVNIYFKTTPQAKQYNSIVQQTQSIQGLFQTSFYLNPGKINIKIYQSTKLLYRIDQLHRKNNKIPILIMNNLTDQNYQNSFYNYYSQLDITNAYQNVQNKKAFQEKKCMVVPLVFQNQNGEAQKSKKTYMLTQWNYQQTDNYLVLYWPSKYDFLKAFLLKLMNKPYHPEIINQIYICRRSMKAPIFKKVNIATNSVIAPRFGTSSYEFQGNLFIFGGFYEKEKNYLQLQHDITVFDLHEYERSQFCEIPIQNIKNQLYSSIIFDNRVKKQQKPNSFVRPRMQIEFFDKEQIFSQDNNLMDQNYKAVIMMGGYGQNFLRPYSLLTYYYYLLIFKRDTRRLQSIERRIIYNKAIPINTKEMTKNLCVIKTNKKNKSGILQPKKLTDPDAYALYRNTFKIDSKNGEEEFNYKFKYMFCEDQYKTFKHEIKKIQELRAQEFDSSSITIQRDPKNNHRIALEKDGKKKWVSLRLQISSDMSKKIQGTPKEVNLTHESIIYIDVWNSIICAIVKHQKYTHGKSVLVQYNTKTLQTLNFQQDNIPYICMAWIKQFDYDLTLHILIICNKSTIAILHGQKLGITQRIKQFIVKRKKNKSDISSYEIRDRQQLVRKNEQITVVNTIFFRHRNKIISIDFIGLQNSYQFYISCKEIQLNIANDNYSWSNSHLNKFDPTNKYQFCFSQQNFVRMEQLRFVQYYKNNNENILVIEYNRKRYVCQVSCNKKILQLVQEQTRKIQFENMEKGIILLKTQDKYNDSDFM